MDISIAIAKLMRHRQWGEASLRLLGRTNAELIEQTRSTIEIGERLFRERGRRWHSPAVTFTARR